MSMVALQLQDTDTDEDSNTDSDIDTNVDFICRNGLPLQNMIQNIDITSDTVVDIVC